MALAFPCPHASQEEYACHHLQSWRFRHLAHHIFPVYLTYPALDQEVLYHDKTHYFVVSLYHLMFFSLHVCISHMS